MKYSRSENVKLKNNSKKRNATANEIAKTIIINKLELAFYYTDNDSYLKNYSKDFNKEICRHIEKHIGSITKKLNPNNEDIEQYY